MKYTGSDEDEMPSTSSSVGGFAVRAMPQALTSGNSLCSGVTPEGRQSRTPPHAPRLAEDTSLSRLANSASHMRRIQALHCNRDFLHLESLNSSTFTARRLSGSPHPIRPFATVERPSTPSMPHAQSMNTSPISVSTVKCTCLPCSYLPLIRMLDAFLTLTFIRPSDRPTKTTTTSQATSPAVAPSIPRRLPHICASPLRLSPAPCLLIRNHARTPTVANRRQQ